MRRASPLGLGLASIFALLAPSGAAAELTLVPPAIGAVPDSMFVTLLTGGEDVRTLTLSNDGGDTLDFVISAATPGGPVPLGAAAESNLATPVFTLPKGADDPRSGAAELLAAGGPDGFGYHWTDSKEPGGPVFDWVDLVSLTAPLPFSGDDATSGPVDMGMSFPFYGDTFTTVRISTNGFLSFSDPAAPYTNQALPSAGGVAHMVAPMWDDLIMTSPSAIYAYNDGQRFIVTWWGARLFGDIGFHTFQALLYPSGEIRFQYLTLTPPPVGNTIGIQNGSKTVGLTVSFNTSYLSDSMAVRIQPPAQWLSAMPISGRIAAGESQQIEVHVDATGLPGGTFLSSLQVASNDPDENPLSIPVRLDVTPAPDLAVTPDALDLGMVFVGTQAQQTIMVTNQGSAPLSVNDIQSSDGELSASPSAFVLAPTATRLVTVGFTPSSVRTLQASLTVVSNDPDTPAMGLSVDAEAVAGPSVTVAPESLDVALVRTTGTTRTVQITNQGGGPFEFHATPIVNPLQFVVLHGNQDSRATAKGEADLDFGVTPMSVGGPDLFGYTYDDSDEPGGPVFQWEDVRVTGTQITMVGDDVNQGPFPVGFAFPFYGDTMTSFRVCTNGFVSFSSGLASYGNVALPNNGSGVPENLLAVFWDDLTFGSTPRAYYHSDGSRLVIQFQDVIRLGESGHPNTFEIVLYADGTIVYQYLSMNAQATNSNTIGIQNGTRDDGLGVAFNASYARDQLALRFRPPAQWLTVDPASGTVPPSGSLELTVGFDTHELAAGPYQGRVRIVGNDPGSPMHEVITSLVVEDRPRIVVDPTELQFGAVEVGDSASRHLRIMNQGNMELQIAALGINDPDFSVAVGSLNVAPFSVDSVEVTYHPSTEMVSNGNLALTTNDPGAPTLNVGLSGSAQVSPAVVLGTPTLFAALAPSLGPIATQAVLPVSFMNGGGGVLHWSAEAIIAPSGTWLAIAPDSGSTVAGEHDTLSVTIDATGLGNGNHAATVRLTSDDPAMPIVDVPVQLHVGVTPAGLLLSFERNYIQAQSNWLAARITPLGTCDTVAVDASTLRLGGVNPVAPGSPIVQTSCGTTHQFQRYQVLSGLPSSANVSLTAFGLVPGQTWFEAVQFFSFRKPTINGISGSLVGGNTLSIRWSKPSGTTPTSYEVWFSPDSGASWQFLAVGEVDRRYDWPMPTEGAAHAVIEVVAYENDTFLGADYEGPFVISPNVADAAEAELPVRLALGLSGANPVRGEANLELALPRGGPVAVDVFDVRGARLRRLASGSLAPGYHALRWDGRDAAGRVAPPGLYFVRAIAGAEQARLRFTLIR